jgi:hypothetical protein
MPTSEADAAVVTLLDTITASSGYYDALAAGVNLFLGPVRSPEDGCPRKAVFVEMNRETSSRYCGSSSDWREAWVVVYVRGDRSDYTGVAALARACRDAIHCATVTGYTDCAIDSGPNFIRTDDTGGIMWTLVARLIRAT